MQIINYLAVGLLAGLVSLPSYAHEFWMEPSDFQPHVGDVVAVDLVIGTHFDGFSLPYTPDEICLLYTSPSPRDRSISRMPSSA